MNKNSSSSSSSVSQNESLHRKEKKYTDRKKNRNGKIKVKSFSGFREGSVIKRRGEAERKREGSGKELNGREKRGSV